MVQSCLPSRMCIPTFNAKSTRILRRLEVVCMYLRRQVGDVMVFKLWSKKQVLNSTALAEHHHKL